MRGCAEFAACTLENPSPASEAECIVRLSPTDEVRSTAHALSRCYAQCASECGGGSDFACVNDYNYPGTLHDSSIHVTQTFWWVLADKPLAGLDVSFCRPGTGCDDPIITVTTDATGTYQADVPIKTEPLPEAGFRGYRLVHGETGRLPPHRLHTSRPLLVDHEESTGLASEELTQKILPMVGLKEPLSMLFLQIFDCRTVGAGGVFFEVDGGQAQVYYVRGPVEWGDGPTVAAQEGAAAAVDLAPGEYHEIRALTADGTIVATDRVYLPGDAMVLSSLYPTERK